MALLAFFSITWKLLVWKNPHYQLHDFLNSRLHSSFSSAFNSIPNTQYTLTETTNFITYWGFIFLSVHLRSGTTTRNPLQGKENSHGENGNFVFNRWLSSGASRVLSVLHILLYFVPALQPRWPKPLVDEQDGTYVLCSLFLMKEIENLV